MKHKQSKSKSTPESTPADQEKKESHEEARSDQDSRLRQTVDTLQKERDDLFAKLQRVSADYANYEKRVPKLIADSVGYEKERVLKSFLPALDNFEHTLQADHSADNIDVMVQGIRIIYDQILGILKSHGVEQIQSVDQVFDPTRHEAMMQRSEEGTENNQVLEEFQKGYTLNGRVIRPSKVVVNKLSTESTHKEGSSQDAASEPPGGSSETGDQQS